MRQGTSPMRRAIVAGALLGLAFTPSSHAQEQLWKSFGDASGTAGRSNPLNTGGSGVKELLIGYAPVWAPRRAREMLFSRFGRISP